MIGRVHQGPADTVIVGAGITGLSVARYLSRTGQEFSIADSRDTPPDLVRFGSEFPAVPLLLGAFEAQQFQDRRRLIVSPGVPVSDPAIAAVMRKGVEIIGDIELFAREAKAPVIAVTGSNGKTTVATLLGEMIGDQGREVLVGGNIGTPALDLLLQPLPDYYVLELSSFQLETTYSLNPVAATVLNVSPDHMDRYADLSAYTTAKQRIFRGSGVRISNRDDVLSLADADPTRVDGSFGLSAPAGGEMGLRRVKGADWLALGDNALMPVSELAMRGRHNIANALAAMALGYAIGLDTDGMLDTLRRFKGLPHRSEWIGQYDGVDWYNDSKGTNVGATIAAVSGLECSGDIILIAGGEGKGADFSPLTEFARQRVRTAVLIGRDAVAIAEVLQSTCSVLFADDMEDAVTKAAMQAMPGDAVLLSPACASFDMFDNYMQRGEVFRDAVQKVVSP